MNRAYSILQIKSIKEDERVIEGIATTPTPDRVKDIVEPMGAQFVLPMPLLWQHRSDQPVGHVEFAKPNKNGIPFKARIFKSDDPGEVQSLLDKAWQNVKLQLVRAVSIGFTINAYEILKEGGWRITEWEWLELSLVTIPANAEATITAIKSIDAELLAASGHKQSGKERTVKAGVTASKSTNVVKAMEAKTMKKSIAEQISAFEATRQAKAARMTEIMDASAEKGETLDEAATEEYDGLAADLKSIDAHLVRLREHEKANVAKAVAVEKIDDATKASDVRAGVRVENVRPNVEKGISFARMVMAKCISTKLQIPATDVAKARWPNNPEIELALKAAVDPMNSTNSSTLVEPQMLQSEFIEYLWPKTIIGRIPGLRRVPFNIKVQRQTSVAAVNWVGESKPKPLGRGALDTVTLLYFKIAGIVGITEEIVRFSNPAAETMVRNDLANGIVKLMDHDFLDPEKAVAAGVSPASVSNGVTPVAATGTTYAHFTADVTSALANYDNANIDTSDLVIVMNTRLARTMSLMLNALGQRSFPDLTAAGGSILGYPVITSSNVDRSEDSPIGGDNMFFLKPSDILLADDGQVTVDVSREASVQMDSAPDDPTTASTVMVSAFQQNLIFVRAERFINWLKARNEAVQYISFAAYANATS